MTWRMRFIEIDGKRHDVPCCHSCPCYDNRDDGWECKCKHPDGDGVSAEHGGVWWGDEENFGPNCPLREKPEMAEGVLKEMKEYKWEPTDKDHRKECHKDDPELEMLRYATLVASKQRVLILDDRPAVATIECEAMEKALAYMSELIGKVETAIKNSEPIMQGIYLERLKHAIMTEHDDMIHRQVEAEE